MALVAQCVWLGLEQWEMTEGGALFGDLPRVEAEATLSERDPNTMSDYEMIQHVHIKQLASLHDLARH